MASSGEQWNAQEIVRLRHRLDNVERSSQLAYSTVEVPDGGDGTVDMTVPEAVGRGVQAGFDAAAVDEKLDTERAVREEAIEQLGDKLADAELGLEGAGQRLDAAEGQIEQAFLGIDDALTLAEQAKSNMPNRVDDPDFSFGDKHWQGTGGTFANGNLYVGIDPATFTNVAETLTRVGTTAGNDNWGTQGSTYELRFDGYFAGGSLQVRFGHPTNAALQVTKTITSNANFTEPIRLTWSAATIGPLQVRLQMTTNGVDEWFYTSTVSVTDVTTITEVKQTADSAASNASAAMTAASSAAATSAAAITQDSALKNPIFEQWAGALPDGWESWSGTTVLKETALVRTGSNAARMTVSTGQAGMAYPQAMVQMGFAEAVTVTADFMLVSGDALTGSGVLLDWQSTDTSRRTEIRFGDMVPSPSTGVWYRVSKTILAPSGATAENFQYFKGFLMGNFTSFGAAEKDIIFDRLSLRQATNEEIAALDAKADAASAVQLAESIPQVLHGVDAGPSGTAPEGSIWFNHKGSEQGNVQAMWVRVSGQWVETPVSSEAIANLDVGKLTAGGATIAEVVAQAIASATAEFQRADIKNLFVTAGATINEAVIDQLWADVVVANALITKKWISSEAIVDELVGKTITAVTINGGTINGVSMVAGEFTTEADFDPNTTTYGIYMNSQVGMIVNGMLEYVVGTGGFNVPAQMQAKSALIKFTIDAKQAYHLSGDSSVTDAETTSELYATGLTMHKYVADATGAREERWTFLYQDRLEMTSYGRPGTGAPNAGAWLEPGRLRISSTSNGVQGELFPDRLVFSNDYSGGRVFDASVADVLKIESPRIDLNAANGVYVNGRLLGDTGWIDLAYASGFTAGTAGQLSYRVVDGIVFIRGGAAGDIAKGSYQVVAADPIPAQYRPAQHYRTGGMGTGMNGNTGIEINATDGLIRLGWRGDEKPSWFAAGCSYPVDP
ncbi:hypothetical protein ACSAGD_10755 [Paramicrobacterium sp. CJ85]|uniref:hypothetical protein n=1 Tax=Paramicrobacterium sp. CJ85 TaxID=3445355 RepID=UPI003F5E95E2